MCKFSYFIPLVAASPSAGALWLWSTAVELTLVDTAGKICSKTACGLPKPRSEMDLWTETQPNFAWSQMSLLSFNRYVSLDVVKGIIHVQEYGDLHQPDEFA